MVQSGIRDTINWDINQDISIEEIKEAILATPKYNDSGPDEILFLVA